MQPPQRSMVLALAVVLLPPASSTPAPAGSRAGLKALAKGNYEKALNELEPVAREGDVEAQLALGELYRDGLGVPFDLDQAARWFERAAEQGSAEAQLALADLLARGNLPSTDRGRAIRWYRAAADQEQVTAQRRLGDAYHEGRLVERDDIEAARWYRACAEQESARCQGLLGTLYAEGHGVEQDDLTALAWFRRSADGGDAEGMVQLARFFLAGRGTTPHPVAAVALLEKAAAQGHAEAKLDLAPLYLAGENVPRDRVKAIVFAARFAARGRPEARALIDDVIDTFTEQEIRTAAKETALAFHRGEFEAAALLAKLLAHRGVRSAQYLLGTMCALGWGTSRNPAQAYGWLLLGERYDPLHAASLIQRVSRDLSPAGIAAIWAKIEHWQPTPWKTGDETLVLRPRVGEEDGATPPRLVAESKLKPEYPDEAHASRSEGRVILEAVITADGAVRDVVVVASETTGVGFEESATRAVSQWRYEPATRDGVPLDVCFTIRVDFALR